MAYAKVEHNYVYTYIPYRYLYMLSYIESVPEVPEVNELTASRNKQFMHFDCLRMLIVVVFVFDLKLVDFLGIELCTLLELRNNASWVT